MNPQEVAASLGISVKTRRRWDKAGKLHIARTAGNQRPSRCSSRSPSRKRGRPDEANADHNASVNTHHSFYHELHWEWRDKKRAKPASPG
jgi:hypothetical protein